MKIRREMRERRMSEKCSNICRCKSESKKRRKWRRSEKREKRKIFFGVR